MRFEILSTGSCSATSSSEVCECNGTCPGYGTRLNCPPLIVMAAMAMSQAALVQAGHVRLIAGTIPVIA